MKTIVKEKIRRQAKSVAQITEKSTGEERREAFIKKMLAKSSSTTWIDYSEIQEREKKLQKEEEEWLNQYQKIYDECRKSLKNFEKLNKKEKVNLMQVLTYMKRKIENKTFIITEFNRDNFKQAAESLSKKFQSSSPFI